MQQLSAWQSSADNTRLGEPGLQEGKDRDLQSKTPAMSTGVQHGASLSWDVLGKQQEGWGWRNEVVCALSNHLRVVKSLLSTSWSHGPTHLRGAQPLPTTGVEDKALFTGDSTHHVSWAMGAAVEGGSMSQQRLSAGS